jgi:hypothetical protein
MVRPGMSDGRAFTSYVSNCHMNMAMMKQLQTHDTNQYRKFLQDNADMIMELQANIAKQHTNGK